jgi:hypothetical protein
LKHADTPRPRRFHAGIAFDSGGASSRVPGSPRSRDALEIEAVILVCAAHPTAEAVARCVNCGLHLCGGCRTLEGVRNFCARCRADLRRVTPVTYAAAVEIPAVAPAPLAPRSPWLAAFLSLVPGLGQAYSGRVVRGALVFASAMGLRAAPWLPPLLGGFLYVFNLFDAYRLAQNRSEGFPRGHAPTRFDDVLFLVVGLATVAMALLSYGGFFAVPSHTLLPLAAVAATLLVAHETRR